MSLCVANAETTSAPLAALPLETKLVISGSSGELSAKSNGAAVIPVAAPPEFQGILILSGRGSIEFPIGDIGTSYVSFRNGGQQNADAARYRFQGSQVSDLFDVERGEITVTLRSSYSVAERIALPSVSSRILFEVKDDSKTLFSFTVHHGAGKLRFLYRTGSTGETVYYFPSETADVLFGRGTTANIKLAWNGAQNELWINNQLLQTRAYTRATANWNSRASLTVGASSSGYYSFDDAFRDFAVFGRSLASDTTPPTVPALNGRIVSSSQTQLTWTAASDTQSGLAGYCVFRNGQLIAKLGDALTYIDDTLAGSHTYNYTVLAYDKAGIQSLHSNAVVLTTPVNIPAVPVVEWSMLDRVPVKALPGESLGSSGVTVDLRPHTSAKGTWYDLRLRNDTAITYTHTKLTITLPRMGNDGEAIIDGHQVPIPSEVRQQWRTPTSTDQRCRGTLFGFFFEVWSGQTLLKSVGPPSAAPCLSGTSMIGRTNGMVRVDHHTYVVPEFWERQPRSILVTPTHVVITLFSGKEVLRSGEHAWDRFGVFSGTEAPDDVLLSIIDNLPQLSEAVRSIYREKYMLAPEGLSHYVSTAEERHLLDVHDRWQGVSWDKKYATSMPFRNNFYGEEEPDKTTLFSMFNRGSYLPSNQPFAYSWRGYGDVQWGEGFSAGHYDWLHAAIKRYLRADDLNALRWAMAAARHTITVDYVWTGEQAGLARYEKGDHGDYSFGPTPSHTWIEGLWLAAEITQDPWIREAAVRRAEAEYQIVSRYKVAYREDGALRLLTWPMLALVRSFEHTGDTRYWQMATHVMNGLLEHENRSGQQGYLKELRASPTKNVVQTLMHGYTVRALLAFADRAILRGEWTSEYHSFLTRFAKFISTPMPHGVYRPNSAGPASFSVYWCPPGEPCSLPDASSSYAYNMHFVDLFAWLAHRDNTWAPFARQVWKDYVLYSSNITADNIGYLTNNFPGTESKNLGWRQLFGDRGALWAGGRYPTPGSAAPPRRKSKAVSNEHYHASAKVVNEPSELKHVYLSDGTVFREGITFDNRITLTEPAPEFGLVCTLASSDPWLVDVPSAVVIPPDVTETPFFTRALSSPAGSAHVTITVACGGREERVSARLSTSEETH